MSWHCLPEQAAASLGGGYSDGAPSVPSKWNPTLVMCCLPGSATASLIASLFGTTCERSTASRGADTSMSSAADSPAKTSALPAEAQDLTVSGLAYGRKWTGLLATFDPSSCSLKTAQCSLFADLIESSPTLPRAGLMLSGACYPLLTSAPRIGESESGFSDETRATPVASDGAKGGPNSMRGSRSLSLPAQVARRPEKFPTPIRNDAEKRGNFDPVRSYGLAGHVRMLPTATATAHKGWSLNHNRAETDDRLDYTIEREAHQCGSPGRLNPEFVEWLMGWPIGHTGLEPVAMDRFREWQQQHSPNWLGG